MASNKFEQLYKLRNRIMSEGSGLKLTTDIFPSVDVESVAEDMELAEKGTERGKNNQPPSTSKARDEVELQIIERIESQSKAAHQILIDQLSLYKSRIASLNFDEYIQEIDIAATTGLTNFTGRAANAAEELHAKRRYLKEAEEYLASFKAKNRLDRPAWLPGPGGNMLKWTLIAFLFAIEAIANGMFLMEGSDAGFAGGVSEAVAFSAVNIGFAVLAGRKGVPWIVHRNLFAKLLGFLALVAYLAVAVVVNLALAHYREISEGLFEGGGRIVMDRLWDAPLVLEDIKSWLLFGLGFLFSLVAFGDALVMDDVYPGYGKAASALDERRNDYIAVKDELVNELIDVRDDFNSTVKDILEGLAVRKREYGSILAHRVSLLELFRTQQDHLERACNLLLARYHDANAKARTTKSPRHFQTPYKLNRTEPVVEREGERSVKSLDKLLEEAREKLNGHIQRIGKECDDRINQFRKLDTLFPEDGTNG